MNIHEKLKDEELLLLSRLGDEVARSTLTIRYYARRFSHGRRSSASLLNMLDAQEFSSVYFKTYLMAEDTFRFGITLFKNYFEKLLKNEMNKAVDNKCSNSKPILGAYSLDSSFSDTDLCLHDVIQSDDESADPKVFFEFTETLERLQKLPEHLHPRTVEVMRYRINGYSIDEIIKITKLKRSSIKLMIKRYQDWCKTIIKK